MPPKMKPNNTIFPDPKRSVSHPSTGPNIAPPNRPKEATPEISARDHPNSSSMALKRTLDA